MLSPLEIASLVLVGATWGCSNSFLRKGSTESSSSSGKEVQAERHEFAHTSTQPHISRWVQFLKDQLFKFRQISVWLPYAINQSGSILFYITLSRTDLSIAVPACNALALVFSIFTSWFVLQEPVIRPVPTALGATFVMVGVAICVQSSRQQS
jgi:Putative transmembrane family 234